MDTVNRLQPTPCLECLGERVWAYYYTESGSHYVIPTDAKYNSWGQPKTKIKFADRIAVCTVCGHITFYARYPQMLIKWRPDVPHGEKE
jgi:hypothetical protein